MRCKRCKLYIEEKDYEYYIIHLWETHGKDLSSLKKLYPDANWDLIAELKRNQKITGQAGSKDRFGKESTKEIEIDPIT